MTVRRSDRASEGAGLGRSVTPGEVEGMKYGSIGELIAETSLLYHVDIGRPQQWQRVLEVFRAMGLNRTALGGEMSRLVNKQRDASEVENDGGDGGRG